MGCLQYFLHGRASNMCCLILMKITVFYFSILRFCPKRHPRTSKYDSRASWFYDGFALLFIIAPDLFSFYFTIIFCTFKRYISHVVPRLLFSINAPSLSSYPSYIRPFPTDFSILPKPLPVRSRSFITVPSLLNYGRRARLQSLPEVPIAKSAQLTPTSDLSLFCSLICKSDCVQRTKEPTHAFCAPEPCVRPDILPLCRT